MQVYEERLPCTLWQLFRVATSLYSDRVAIIDDGNTLCYRELHKRVTLAALSLSHSGVRPGQKVAVVLRNSSKVIEIHFACAALQAVVVNLNPQLTVTELGTAISDSKPDVVFADAAAMTKVLEAITHSRQLVRHLYVVGPSNEALSLNCVTTQYEQIPYNHDWGAQDTAEVVTKFPSCDANVPFQMYFTSGTTGCQKKVVLSQGSVVQHAVAAIKGACDMNSKTSTTSSLPCHVCLLKPERTRLHNHRCSRFQLLSNARLCGEPPYYPERVNSCACLWQ